MSHFISIVIPTLNEGAYIGRLLESLRRQTYTNFEVIVVDGGSRDETVKIAREYKVKTIVMPGYGEFSSRNLGAKYARGDILLFTGSDVRFPENFLEELNKEFIKNREVVAVFGPHIPEGAPLVGRLEYYVYNCLRFIFSILPKPLKRFSTSANFIAVRKNIFEKLEGFPPNDINADGIFGQKLVRVGNVKFCLRTYIFASARRMRKMGFLRFNAHYLYVLENFFPFLSKTRLIKNFKKRSKMVHRKIHEI